MDKYDIATFSATQIAPLFNLFGWTWGGIGDEVKIPNLQQIINQIEELIEECKSEGNLSTGRITVEKYFEEDQEKIKVSLDLCDVNLVKE